MDKVVLDEIPFQLELDVLAKRLRIANESPYVNDLRHFVADAQAVAKPKAMYGIGYVESKGEDFVVIDGITFTSRVLRVNLEQAHRVFLYVATCGREIYDWTNSLDGLLQQFWAEAIQGMALRSAARAMGEHVMERYRLGRTSTMAPGSLEDWPLKEQRPLFALMGDTQEAIGVQLSDSLLMIPTKSVSGMRFPTEESFASCQLCPRPECPGRRVAYDESLYDRKYR